MSVDPKISLSSGRSDINFSRAVTDTQPMANSVQSQLIDELETNTSDIGLHRTIKEQLESAREASFTPMALFHANLLGTQIVVDIGMSSTLVETIAQSGQGTQLMILADVENDPRAPSSWFARGVGASLSAPVYVDERCVGSLHVVDARSREFTDGHTEAVIDIAYIIGKRLERFLGPEREERRESLMRRAISPAFAELRNALVPLNLGTADLRMVTVDLSPAIQNLKSSIRPEDEAATMAFDDLVSLIDEISRASDRVREVVMVVEGLWAEGGRSVVLDDLLQTAAGLALHSTRLVGGMKMPEVAPEYTVYARRSVAVAGLSLLLSRAAEANASGVTTITQLTATLEIEPEWFHLRVVGDNLSSEECEKIALEVDMLLLGDKDMKASAKDRQLSMRLTRRS